MAAPLRTISVPGLAIAPLPHPDPMTRPAMTNGKRNEDGDEPHPV